MNLTELEQYLIEHKTATIAEVQQKFSLKYSVVRQMFYKLQEENKIKNVEGVVFEWIAPVPQVNDEQDVDELTDEAALEILRALDEDDDEPDVTLSTQQVAEAITNGLNAVGLTVEIDHIEVGDAVTRYTFDILSPCAHMSSFREYAYIVKDCAQTEHDVRVVEPDNNMAQVAFEIVNERKRVVTLDSVMQSDEFSKSSGKLDFALGRDIDGNNVVVDLTQLPHLLITGTTGSGKSIVLNSMITSLAEKYSPDYVKFVIVDPKRVELSVYNGLPHLLTRDIVTNEKDMLAAMDYLINEMDARYSLIRQTSTTNIVEYNAQAKTPLPYIVFVVDEISEFMRVCKKEFEGKFTRLAQKCRAAGIHIVLATQIPTPKIVTGAIKANTPARITLKLCSDVDSMWVMGSYDGKKLSGFGDMLYMGPNVKGLLRVQGAHVSAQSNRVKIAQIKKKYPVDFDSSVANKIFVSSAEELKPVEVQSTSGLDPLCKKALRFWLEKQNGRASIASIQRNLGIGFNRAGRIVDSLQQRGFIEIHSPSDPASKPLRVLVSLEDLDRLFPNSSD